jgi:hypothetical protein
MAKVVRLLEALRDRPSMACGKSNLTIEVTRDFMAGIFIGLSFYSMPNLFEKMNKWWYLKYGKGLTRNVHWFDRYIMLHPQEEEDNRKAFINLAIAFFEEYEEQLLKEESHTP